MTSIADSGFWNGRRVLVTGHTGFKGSWLCALLLRRGATVCGLALPPNTTPSLWALAPYSSYIDERMVDVRNAVGIDAAVSALRPQTIFHLAAQPLVRRGYAEPVLTYETNVMGTVNVLEAARHTDSVDSVVVVTSDKVYADAPQQGGYGEDARLGGADPYAGSKAAAELVVESYRSSYFSRGGSARIATARAGNVIGGGDFSADRLLADAYRAIVTGAPLWLRHPDAVRPWQHVLDPLHGYLLLAEALAQHRVDGGPFNFGPDLTASVMEVADHFVRAMGGNPTSAIVVDPRGPAGEHETAALEVDSSRARNVLGWKPRWSPSAAIETAAAWYRDFIAGQPVEHLVARDLDAYAR
jgi:CDP-glucose 4,6-dehydratase